MPDHPSDSKHFLCRLWVMMSLISLATFSPLYAVAGKWTPEQLLEHDPAWLRELGLEIPAEELWDVEGGGLLEAIVQVGGCSSGFVSAQGLLITNHHCVFSILQEHSSPEKDLIEGGFLANSRSDELPATNLRATIPHSSTDVTGLIEAAAADTADDLERYQRIDRAKKKLVAECEKKPFRRCRVATDDDGVKYRLEEALEFNDLRLVYAPPRAVGEFGGEIDNWMWPRHTGDFALVRIYADADNQPAEHTAKNRPYQPRRHLQIAGNGVRQGSFVLIAGYPARTYRSLIAAEMAERYELYFPRRSELFRTWLEIIDRAGERDEEARIALADLAKRLANREKNARGQVVGIERGQLLKKKRQLEQKALTWAREQDAHPKAVMAYKRLEELIEEARQTWDRDFLLDHADDGPQSLKLALELTRWSTERQLPDIDRNPRFQERNREQLYGTQVRGQKRLSPTADREMLADFLQRLAVLPDPLRPAMVDQLVGKGADPTSIHQQVQKLLDRSQIFDLNARLQMFEENPQTLHARKDPMLDLAFALNDEIRRVEKEIHRQDGAISRWRPLWRRALAAYLGRPLDPDANGTLRVSLAHVEGYRPRDGIWMEPMTRLGGVVEKHTGKEPFDAPKTVLEAAKTAVESDWATESLHDVPVAFLATGDTTGGSSGSPVLNSKGELVGVNFDRVWENIANDFGYNLEIARNISADIRYLLWMLETVEGQASQRLLQEMEITQ